MAGTMTDHLAQSIELAARVHRGQLDKGGQPYILHSLRVMYATLSAAEDSDEVWISPRPSP